MGQITHDVMLHAAYFSEGFNARPTREWNVDQGHIECMSELVSYADAAEEMAVAAHNVTGDYPGVFDYEVSIDFGKWFRDRVIESGGAFPPQADALRELARATIEFFAAGAEKNSEIVSDLEKALNAVVTCRLVLAMLPALPRPTPEEIEGNYRHDYMIDIDRIVELIAAANDDGSTFVVGGVDYIPGHDRSDLLETVLVADFNWTPRAAASLNAELMRTGIISIPKQVATMRQRN